jgi:hypothetical protein
MNGKNGRYTVTDDRGFFLVTGGGSFNWWTVHPTMASRLPKATAEKMAERFGGNLRPVKEG